MRRKNLLGSALGLVTIAAARRAAVPEHVIEKVAAFADALRHGEIPPELAAKGKRSEEEDEEESEAMPLPHPKDVEKREKKRGKMRPKKGPPPRTDDPIPVGDEDETYDEAAAPIKLGEEDAGVARVRRHGEAHIAAMKGETPSLTIESPRRGMNVQPVRLGPPDPFRTIASAAPASARPFIREAFAAGADRQAVASTVAELAMGARRGAR
jgi:hypothetical protein